MSIKRQTSLSKTFDVETKKLRETNDNQNLSMTCFEHFSNEIYYEIFDYLDGCNIYQAFSKLNHRFEQIINSSSFLLKISFDGNRSQSDTTIHWCRNVILPNKYRILSLHLWKSIFIQEFFTLSIIDSLFNRLESIVLYGMTSENFLSIIPYFQSLSHLFEMTIYLNDTNSTDYREIYQMIFHLPFLKYNSLSMDEDDELNMLTTLNINKGFSYIESLIINHGCTTNGLLSLLCHTSQLKYLSCRTLSQSYHSNTNEILITLPHLTYIVIETYDTESDDFESFMKKICLHLKTLRINQFFSDNYIDPDRWKQLILEYMPQLRRIYIRCYIDLDDHFKNNHLNTFVHQFTSQFWFEHGWNIKLEIERKNISYTIYSNRIKWFDIDENMKNITYSNHSICLDLTQPLINYTGQEIQNSSLNDLSIIDYDLYRWHPLFIDKFSSILCAIQFTSLNISCSNITISTLLKIIQLLPNLDSLRVESFPILQLSKLSDEDTKNLHLISENNKITKIWQSMKMELIEFFLVLCPRIEHLEVNWIIDTDIELFLEFILTKTITHICHLHSLRFLVLNANDKMIEKLQNMIDSKALLSNYLIKRFGENIYLRWKL